MEEIQSKKTVELATRKCLTESESTPETLSPLPESNSSEEELFHLELSEEEKSSQTSGGALKRTISDNGGHDVQCRPSTRAGSPPSKRTAVHSSVPYPDVKKARIMSPKLKTNPDFQVYWNWNSKLEAELSSKNYIHHRSKITVNQRTILLSWLIQVNRQFKFAFDTWCLAASLLDRFLCRQPMTTDCLQLSGCVALFIAAKLEEVNPPGIPELYTVCARSYAMRYFRFMEVVMWTALDYRLKAPRVTTFISILKEAMLDLEAVIECTSVENRLAELAICDPRLAYLTPSRVAESIVRNVYADPCCAIKDTDADMSIINCIYEQMLGDLVTEE